MFQARLVRLEGVKGPCLMLLHRDFLHHDDLPEELVVDFARLPRHPEIERSGEVVYRLAPSTRDDVEPVYEERFDE